MRQGTAVVMVEEDPQGGELQPSAEAQAERLRESLMAIVGRLEREVDRRIGARQEIEQRWLRDIAQYHGRYDLPTLKNLSAAEKSQIFINQTGPKTDALSARLNDLLFPTDDRNWGIGPTPVPALAAEAKAAAKRARQAISEAEASTGQPDEVEKIRTAVDAMEIDARIRAEMAEARRRADLMQEEIQDQLIECQYQAAMRDVIDDGCKVGTGIAKGPILDGQSPTSWVMDPEAGYTLRAREEPRPSFERVDYWHFFPDPDAREIKDGNGTFQRHLMKDGDLRRLARNPSFSQDAIRRLLQTKSRQSAPQFLADLRAINGETHDVGAHYYHVWEYRGPITAEDLVTLAVSINPAALADLPDELDPLIEKHVVIWFCQGEILKFGPHPLDSCECLYSVFRLKKDDSSIWGFGVPHIMRDEQRMLNGGARMMMDNSGLSSGPQIEVDPSVIEPADGKWELRPRKVWKRRNDAPAGKAGFMTYNIDSHQGELANIIELAMRFIDDVTAMPMIAQGEQGARQTQTMGGMTILMNSASVVFRRIVKNFDDDVTTPNIRRAYHWNMQHSQRDEIKGDMKVDARGSSVLLVRELQAQNLMAIALQFGAHPIYGPMLKHPALLRKIFQAHMLQADEVMLTEEEIAQAAANAGQQEDPEVALRMAELDAKVAISEQESETRRYIADVNREIAMQSLAEKLNMTVDGIRADMHNKSEDRQSKERLAAIELEKTEQIGPTGGGLF